MQRYLSRLVRREILMTFDFSDHSNAILSLSTTATIPYLHKRKR
jgi:hypothetical protein